MTNEAINELKKYTLGKKNTEKVEINVLKLNRIINALEQEPCEDAISRQAMLDGLASIAKAKAKSDAQKALMGRVIFFTEHLPPVTSKPRTVHWIKIGKLGLGVKCPFCDEVFAGDKELYNFCPNCGARMVESQESEDNKHDNNY